MERTAPALSRDWDVVVIGTGVGGATVGWGLASRGLSVLFLEKGTRVSAGASGRDLIAPMARLARGRWPNPVSQQQPNGDCNRFFAPLGCALGGSSIYYAAALERMPASDFAALHTPQGLVPEWPVSFSDFLPFYSAAESLYGISPAPEEAIRQRLSEWDLAFIDTMRRNGLRPEPLQIAMRYDEQCEECIGKVCPRACKADSLTACLEPALRSERCAVLDRCDVQTLDVDAAGHRIRAARARHRDNEIEVRARIFILAAGALHSPQILLRSTSPQWPRGLANRSDQVGRNLMFHTADNYAVWAPRRLKQRARQNKSLSMRDFYLYQGRRLGYVQSLGVNAGSGDIAMYLKDSLRRHGLRNEFLLKVLVKLPSHMAAALLGNARIFSAMTEDDPSPENRVMLDPNEPDGAKFAYTITEDLRQRADELCKMFAQHIRPWRLVRMNPELSMNYGHPCGTCRFGDDPAASVLDRNCKAHDLENLYVLDASFMPRSGAVNPSLTIAANSLRVAPVVAEQLARRLVSCANGRVQTTPAAPRGTP
jgi:choline dehydrogenase-like flavoprotein